MLIESRVTSGVVHVFVTHTSASLVIQENADPAVLRDLQRWVGDVAPESRTWEHDSEGPDDMPSHARSAMTKTSESIPVRRGALALGTWQALYLWEHRTAPHRRTVLITVMGVLGRDAPPRASTLSQSETLLAAFFLGSSICGLFGCRR